MKLPLFDAHTLPPVQISASYSEARIHAPTSDGVEYVTVPTDRAPHRHESGTETRSQAHATVVRAYGTGYTVSGAIGQYHAGSRMYRVYRVRRRDY